MAEQDSENTEKPVQNEEEMLQTIQGRLEDLLSKQMLAEDPFIQQHVNAQMYIPFRVIGTHHYIKCLGAEMGQLLAAARRSEKLAVDEDGLNVRPLLKSKRNTLILREIPVGASEDDVRTLLDKSPEKDKIVAIKPDINQTMFVTFKTDEAAQNAALWLLSQKIRGEKVKCAVKSEHFLRSFFPAGPTPPQQHYTMSPGGVMWPQSQWNGGQGKGSYDANMDYDYSANMGWDTGMKGGGKGSKGSRGNRNRSSSKGKGKGSRQRNDSGGANATAGLPDGPPLVTASPALKNMGSPAFPALSAPRAPPALRAEALGVAGGTVSARPSVAESAADVDDLEPKFNHAYRKYTREALIEVCNRMDEIKKPDGYREFEKAIGPQHENAIMFLNSPCKDWAPLPTPVIRNRDADDNDEEGGYGRRRPSSQEAWGRRSHSKSVDRGSFKDSWNNGEAWSSAGRGSRSKSRDMSWDEGNFSSQRGTSRSPYHGPQKSPYHGPQKVAKRPSDAEGTKAMTWAEKVKAAATPSEAQPKWVPKKES